MQNLPSLHEQQYIKTRRRMHAIAKLVGRLREVLVEPIGLDQILNDLRQKGVLKNF